jgi:predicted Rossmann fold flavoprotein
MPAHAPRIIVAGGGAAGFFAAIACSRANPQAAVSVLEKSARFLGKVRISGGGRCNVTHADFEPREFATRYPRGEQALIGSFRRFSARETIEWFEARGVKLKVEEDGRIFPTTDSSQTIIDCLMSEAARCGVVLLANRAVESAVRREQGGFALTLSGGERMECDRLLLATGGCRTPALASLAVSLGHSIMAPVPSLFTLHIETPWLHSLAGITISDVEVSVSDLGLSERGPLLITHWGLSGPSILRLSAWGARPLATRNYRFVLRVNWLPNETSTSLLQHFHGRRQAEGGRLVQNSPIAPLPARLWEQLVAASGLAPGTRWSTISKEGQQHLSAQLQRTDFEVVDKSLNKDEFVTCGGVKLAEVNFKTMESRICPGLYFAGELLDIDGITGGFNFQAAWTTGWIAGRAMAEAGGLTTDH